MKFKYRQTEESVHKQVVNYLKNQYPQVLFRTDGGGLRLPTGLAVKYAALQKSRAFPDLFIAEPKEYDVPNKTVVHGLFLELKAPDQKVKRTQDQKKISKGESRLRRAGDWWDDHVEEQAAILAHLRGKGYYADFAVGFEDAKAQIDKYLKSEPRGN